LPRSDTSTVPVGTRMIHVQMLMTRLEGSDNDGLAENLALSLL
jgi:hypothetical protein